MQRQWNVQVSVIAFQTKALAANMKESIRSRRPPHRVCPKNKSRLIPIDSLQNIAKIQCQREASQKQNVQSSKARTRDRVKKGFVNNLWSRGDAWQLKSTNLQYNLDMPRRDNGFCLAPKLPAQTIVYHKAAFWMEVPRLKTVPAKRMSWKPWTRMHMHCKEPKT